MEEEAYPELSVALVIRSPTLPPDAVTGQLGIEPTVAWRAGDRSGGSDRPQKDDAWILRLPARPALEFDDLLEELLLEIEPRKSELIALAARPGTSVRVDCVGYISTVVPAIYLENDLLSRISTLGVDMDIDLFLIARGEQGES